MISETDLRLQEEVRKERARARLRKRNGVITNKVYLTIFFDVFCLILSVFELVVMITLKGHFGFIDLNCSFNR